MAILYRRPTTPLGSICVLAVAWLAHNTVYAQAEPTVPANEPTTPIVGGAPAEPEPSAEAEPPWAQGVPPERRAEAQRLLDQGNELFLRGDHRAALNTYQEALKSWDHPAIRFNLARALIQLDRTLEAYENIEQALRHGKSALEDAVYQEAQNYLRLLRGQVGEIEVQCAQKGTEVRVDGRPFLSCPGTKRERLLPGAHVLLSNGPGYLPESREIVVQAGKPQAITVRLTSLSDATRTERRWAVWKPWVVVGSGAALGGVAGLLGWQASQHNSEYGRDVATLCNDKPCKDSELPVSTRNLDRRAHRENKSAVVIGSLAGAATLTGLALVLFNQPRPIAADVKRSATIAPLISREIAGAAVTGSF